MGRNDELDEEMELQDAPAMSHAQKRKLKKRKRGEEGSDGEHSATTTKKSKTETKEDGETKTKNVPARLHSVWVGNMAFKTTPDDLRTFFKGLEGEITRVKMPRKEGGEKGPNKGFAYVDFATAEAKEAAIAYSEKPLHGRKLLIKDDSNWQGSHAVATLRDPTTSKAFIMTKTSKSILVKQKQAPCPVLFVGNLPFGTTSESLREHLEKHAIAKGGKRKEKQRKRGKKEDDSGDEEQDSDEEKSEEDRKKSKKNTEDAGILTFETQPEPPAGHSQSDSASDSENDSDDPKPTESKIQAQPKTTLTPAEALGLRAIRLGTFEDTGECKGWAFLDFLSTPHATAALLRLPNHYLHSRELKLEYASPDAVRRGGFVEDAETPGQWVYGFNKNAGGEKKKSKRKDMRPPRAKRALVRQEREEEREREKSKMLEEGRPVVRPAVNTVVGVRRERPKPGSALAMAKRESVAIVQSQGKKVVFS